MSAPHQHFSLVEYIGRPLGGKVRAVRHARLVWLPSKARNDGSPENCQKYPQNLAHKDSQSSPLQHSSSVGLSSIKRPFPEVWLPYAPCSRWKKRCWFHSCHPKLPDSPCSRPIAKYVGRPRNVPSVVVVRRELVVSVEPAMVVT